MAGVLPYLASRQLSPVPMSTTSGTVNWHTPSISRFTIRDRFQFLGRALEDQFVVYLEQHRGPMPTRRQCRIDHRVSYTYATVASPFFSTSESSLSEAPEGRFSPRSHLLTKLLVTFR